MSSDSDNEIAPEHWWLYRRTDDDHYIFAFEFSKSVLCHIQRITDWLVRVDRPDGTILFSQHGIRSRDDAFALGESVLKLCAMLHREVVTERSQARKPMYVGKSHRKQRERTVAVTVAALKPLDVRQILALVDRSSSQNDH